MEDFIYAGRKKESSEKTHGFMDGDFESPFSVETGDHYHYEPAARDNDFEEQEAAEDKNEKDESGQKKAHDTTVEGEGITYKTSDVADILGIESQDVRNYCQQFSDFLNIDRTVGGQRRFTKENIDRLAAILNIKNANGYTIEQTRAALATEEGQILVARDEPEKLKKLMEWTIAQMGEVVEQIVTAKVSEALSAQTTLLLESKEEKENKQQQLEVLTTKLTELNDANAQLISTVEQLQTDSKEKDEKIESLIKLNNEILNETKRKKKGLFFRK